MTQNEQETLLILVEDFVCKVTVIVTSNDPETRVEYLSIRKTLLDNTLVAPLLPTFIKSSRTANDLRTFCQGKGGFAARRQFINGEFEPLRRKLESAVTAPADDEISALLSDFSPDGVHAVWAKALERRNEDPDAAITAARTLLETTCKHILDRRAVTYDDGVDLPVLYGKVAALLTISPGTQTDSILKSICGGCTNLVTSIGALRNKASDAHGRGEKFIGPEPRHAMLAVNLAGTLATFLVESFNIQFGQRPPN